MRVILTRPEHEGHHWLAALRQRGVDAVLWPLIEIAPAPDDASVQAAAQRWRGFAAAMFVSANAVRGLHAAVPGLPTSQGPRAWATGPGTCDALLAAGWPSLRIDCPAADAPQFDSETLWPRVRYQVRPGTEVLLVRGGDAAGAPTGRDWLARRIEAAGGHVSMVVAYVRRAPAWRDEQQAAARAAAVDGSLWVFSSSEAVANLRQLLPGQDWQHGRALATHERIAAAARGAGFGAVALSRPALPDVIASIESSA